MQKINKFNKKFNNKQNVQLFKGQFKTIILAIKGFA